MTRASLCVALGAVLFVGGTANAGTMDYPGSPYSNAVASNDPAHGNIWTGLAQSFTAQDANVLFGFYVASSTSVTNNPLLFSLYSGDGQFSNLLEQSTAQVSLGVSTSELVQVDFSSISLTPGNQYTVVASLPFQQLPPENTVSDLSVLYNSLSNSYSGGRFYFTGASYDQNQPLIADRDLAFNVTPIPEPTAIMLLALGGLVMLRRRHSA